MRVRKRQKRGTTSYQQGWMDCAAWTARLIDAVRWDTETKKRLRAMTALALDPGIAPKRRPEDWK